MLGRASPLPPVLGQHIGLAGRGRPGASAKGAHPGQSLALMLHVHLPGLGEGCSTNPLESEDSEEQGAPLPLPGPSGLCSQGWALDKLGHAGSRWA